MDFNIDVRRKQLDSLDEFIKSSKENFDSILKALSWTEDAVRKDDLTVTCTFNPEHRVTSNSEEKHLMKCSLQQENYLDTTPLLSEPLHDKLASIHLSKEQKVDLFSNAVKNCKEFNSVWKIDDPDPKSADRIYCTYSPDERRIIYEHCVASTTGPKEPPDFNIYKLYKSTAGVPLTADEERARERDLKRRSFRYKKTFTSHDRDPVEVMRDVINGQMELYSEWLTARKEIPNEPHTDADIKSEHDGMAMEKRKGPRTPEHEAPDDDIDYNGNGNYDETDECDRRDSRHSSSSRRLNRDRTKSPRRRRSSREYQQAAHRRLYSSRTRSRSRSRPRSGGSRQNQHYNHNNGSYSDRGRDRSRDKRKSSYSSRHSNDNRGERRKERTRSRSPRAARSRR